MWSTLTYDFHVPTSSALSVNSSGLSVTVTFGYPSCPFGLRTLSDPTPSLRCPTSVRPFLPSSQSFVTMFCVRPSQSSCWFASNFNATTTVEHQPRQQMRVVMAKRDTGLLKQRHGLLNSLSQGVAERDESSGSTFKFPGAGGWVKRSNFELVTALPTGDGNTTNTAHSARVQSVAQKGITKNAKHSQDAGFQPQPFTDSKNQEHSTGYTRDQLCRDSALNFSVEPRICIPPWAGGVCSN